MQFNEAISPQVLNKREVEVVILEEGPGNRHRKCWYGPEAIETGRDIFRGAQVFANHPSKTQQMDLPERDVREIVGRIKETYVSKGPNGKKQLRGKLKVLEGDQYDWVLSLMHESIQSKREGFPPVAQVSIHADGDVEKRVIEGDQYNYVKNIKSAVSVDIVTKGGIQGAGFTKFLESYYGGTSSMTNEERLAQIRMKIENSLNSEDVQFLESLEESEPDYPETDEGIELFEDGSDFEEVFALEDGTLVNHAGEIVDPSEVYAMDDEGEVYTPEEIHAAAMEVEDDAGFEPEFEDDEEYEEYPGQDGFDHSEIADDEVPISELATRFPEIANEIDQEEFGVQESDRDVDIVNLKFENKLLRSRAIADVKIAESGLPAGFISVDDLLGKTAEDMDRIIESRQMMVENIVNLVESQRPMVVDAPSLRESGDAPNVGSRILSGSIMPTY